VLVVVDVEPEQQLERLRERSGLDDEAAMARIAAQATRSARLAVADVVLANHTDTDDLVGQVDRLWLDLRARATPG
jgi:dephospho-CoA kinase